jgi:RNA polymerase sigma factor (sigma-70 family)
MADDAELLRRYSADRSEPAFAELVQRHIDFVYAAALRQVGGDAHHAADVAQYVFTEVANKAAVLARHHVFKGWLFTTTRHAAANVVRAEHRRRRREQEAGTMNDLTHESARDSEWAELRPVLDEALGALRPGDRDAVFLRFFEGRDYPEIGARLSLSPNVTRLRVERALEKMRAVLARRGVGSTTTALAAVLTTQAAVIAPAGLGTAVTGTALATATSGGLASLFVFMSMTKVQATVVGGLLLAGMLGVALQQRAHAGLRDDLVSVRQQSREVARLRAENERLNRPAVATNDREGDELAKLRAETDALKKQIAAAASIPLAPGMVPSSAWKNVGRATPGAALETLLWAAENGDIQTTGKMVGFDPLVRLQADAIYGEMPDVLRKAGEVTSVEEMVGLAWTVGAQLAGAQLGAALPPPRKTSDQPDDLTLFVHLQKADGTLCIEQMKFHRTDDGWQWMLSHRNLDFVGSGIGHYTDHILDHK